MMRYPSASSAMDTDVRILRSSSTRAMVGMKPLFRAPALELKGLQAPKAGPKCDLFHERNESRAFRSGTLFRAFQPRSPEHELATVSPGRPLRIPANKRRDAGDPGDCSRLSPDRKGRMD